MKAIRKYGDDLIIEVEGGNVKEIWKQLAAADDAFGFRTCAAIVDGQTLASTRTHFTYREVDGNDYYDMTCVDRANSEKLFGYRKSWGQHKKGQTLFPKEGRDETPENHIPGLAGWSKYVRPS